MWQAMLLSAGLPSTKRFLIHGFIYTKGEKISKSEGNIVDPFALVKKYGTDAVRYYLLRYVHPVQDSDFTIDKLEKAYNADLANGLGNLVSRVSGLIEQNNVKIKLEKVKADKELAKLLDGFHFDQALKYIWEILANVDGLISQTKPWELVKAGNIQEVNKILNQSVNDVYKASQLLKPFLPEIADKVEKIFSAKKIKKAKPLFPRLS
jgi:methionyl-tRNA synthetase